MDIDEAMLKMSRIAADFGLPFGKTVQLYNSRLAQELSVWADSKNAGDRFHSEVFKAYFVDGKNIAQIPVLIEIASSLDLPRDEASEILETRAFKDAVDADWALSREKQITAVPTFVLNQDRLVGAQSYNALEMLLESNGVKRR